MPREVEVDGVRTYWVPGSVVTNRIFSIKDDDNPEAHIVDAASWPTPRAWHDLDDPDTWEVA